MINIKSSNTKKYENPVNILIIFISVIFMALAFRSVPVDLQNSDNYNEDLTAFSLNVVNNWLIDGIITDNFVMHSDFASVEFENNHNRNVYISYPPGSLVPLYLIAKVAGKKEISIGFVKRFVQCQYYLSIFLLGLLFYICLKILEVKSRLLITALPVMLSSLWAFLPLNFYYMRNIYFADQAVILLSIIFFLIEIMLHYEKFLKHNVLLQILSSIVLFVGILTDYYFFCIGFVAFCFRIISNFEKYPDKTILYRLFSSTWPMIVSTIIAVGLFIGQLLIVPDGFDLLIITFLMRTSSGTEFGGLKALINNFNNDFSVFFLPFLIVVTIICLIFPLIRNKYSNEKQMIIRWLSIIILSTVLHTIILREHTIIHEFSMLKYNLVVVFIVFAFLCWVYVNYKTNADGRMKIFLSIALTLIFCLILYCLVSLQSYNQYYYNQRMLKQDHSVAQFIRANTNYYDVVYSPDYEINWNPPQDLAISKKRIYRVSSLKEIPVNALADYAIINILISEETMKRNDWIKLNTKNISFEKSDKLYLFKFSKESIRHLIN